MTLSFWYCYRPGFCYIVVLGSKLHPVVPPRDCNLIVGESIFHCFVFCFVSFEV